LTGYSAEELMGSPAATVFGAASRVLDAEHSGPINFTRKDGTTAQVELRIASENISGARVIVMTDISYRIKTEGEREGLLARERAARAEAERSNLLKEEFLATLSHELRNPLNAILGWATILGRTEGLAPSVLRGVQAIERNSRVQARMIADLLDYAGITFGKMRLAVATVDPYSVVRSALDVVAASATARRVQLNSRFDGENLVVEGDAVRLQQVVVNLLSNAIKFSTEGASVEVSASRADKDFELVVRDHGKGISEDFLPRIFERFSQQDSSSTKSYGGLGLGLAIVKQLVDLHAGRIEVASEGEGKGATFIVRIPLSEKLLMPAVAESQRLRSLDLSGVVALVVEDDGDARELTKRILSDAGAQVIEAPNAEAALKCVHGSGANLLISDIGMAEKDGYQLIRSLRAQGFGPDVLPAIALTAFARVQDRADAIAAGFQDHVVKPIDPSTLISRVSSLRHSRRRRQP
jgi:signal transduction histidine kinase/CheY-like chemotaxis protein